jgi:hypothetical protein
MVARLAVMRHDLQEILLSAKSRFGREDVDL